MPKKTFSAGEELLASDVNTYLMNQAVMVFDDESARTTALPSPGEGMVTYLKDVDLVQVWDGSEWDEISGGGSITVSSTAPGDPEEGDLWFNEVSGKTFVYYTDSDGSQWVEVGQAGGLATASVVTSGTRTLMIVLCGMGIRGYLSGPVVLLTILPMLILRRRFRVIRLFMMARIG